MQTLQTSFGHTIHTTTKEKHAGTGLLTWCRKQESSHFVWVAVILAAQACVLIPVTLLSIVTNGNNQALFIAALAGTAFSIVTVLSALTTRYTIPVFLLAILIDLFVVAASWLHLFN